MKKNLIFILFIILFLFIPKVNAETFNVNPHVSIGGYTVPTYWGINANTTTNLLIKLEDWQLYSETYNANFGYFEVCANFPVKFNNNNADCSDGCFSREFNTYNTGASCTIYDTNYSGTKYYVFFSIKEYGYKNADTLPIVYDTFSFNNPYSYSVYFSLDNSYLSNEDLYLNFADQIKNEQLLQGTNDKLDTTIDQNDTIIDQNQDIINNQDATNDKLDDLNDNLTNSNIDSPNNAFSEFESYLPENGVITQLITLPISLFQRVLSSINGTCSEYNLGNLMGTDLILPCINIINYIGSTLWNVIDILFSGFFVLVIGKKMIKAFNNFSSMEEGDVLD